MARYVGPRPVRQVNFPGVFSRPDLASLLCGFGVNDGNLRPRVQQGGDQPVPESDGDMRPRRKIYPETGLGRGSASVIPAAAAFPGRGWQSFVRTPSFPHWEQNVFAGRQQLNRS